MRLVEIQNDTTEFQTQRLVYETRSGRTHRIHITHPGGTARPLNDDHAFLLGAAMAFVLGENYAQDVPASDELQRGFQKAKRIWRAWHPYRADMRATAPIRPPAPLPDGRGMGSFFSGGVDSIYTALKLGSDLTAFISIAHVEDEPEAVRDGFARLSEMTPFADATGREHLYVATNMMTAIPAVHDAWAYLSHGAALAAVAHSLSGELAAAQISSSYTFDQLIPWGSHPDVDPLFASEAMAIGHFGADADRVEKTFAIAGDARSLAVLSVCGKGRLEGPYVNCSRCQKCLRTMLTLDLAGADPQVATSFDWSGYAPDNAREIILRTESEYIFAREIRNRAAEMGRADIVDALTHLIDRSGKYRFLTNVEMSVRKRFRSVVRIKRPLLAMRSGLYRLLGLKRGLDT